MKKLWIWYIFGTYLVLILVQIQCAFNVDLVRTSCGFGADLVRIWSGFGSDLMRIVEKYNSCKAFITFVCKKYICLAFVTELK